MAGWSQLSETKHSEKEKKNKPKTTNHLKADALNNYIWVCIWSTHNLSGASDVLADSLTAVLLRETELHGLRSPSATRP